MRGRRQLFGAAAALVLALAAACGGSGSNGSSSGGSSGSHTPVTLTVWHQFAAEEAKPFADALTGFAKRYPWIHLNLALQPNPANDTFDPNLIAAIKGGNAPDVAIGFTPAYAGQYCSSGLWEDLTPFMQKDHMSISQFAPATISYTSFGGKQCALPSLTDAFGLYYNKKMFAKAGITSPPKTMTELAADAKRLTVRNSDGSIKVAGFVPLNQWEELDIADLGNAFGATWFDKSGKAQLANEPGWTAAFEWQKQLVDWYGYSNLEKFFATYTNSEFNATNAFETGKVAMVFDGEWRTKFITRDHPTLDYGTAPFPVADNQPQLYGSGRVGGTILGIPQGTKHPQEAWDLLKYLATDTNYLVTLANSLGNVPTTTASGNSPNLHLGPQFKTFVDIWNNPRSSFYPPLTAAGAGYAQLVDNFDAQWQAGNVSDLQAGLQKLDTNIDNQQQLGGQTP
jgi:multiple sugar transport system substrate-binding protein